MAVATLLSRVLGLVRELVMASSFGATGLTDAFLIAYRIPNVLRDLFAEGAFSSAFVPVFTESLQKGKAEANKLLWSLFVLLFIITGLISVGIYFGSESLAELFAPSFTEDPEKFQSTVVMIRIMSPFLLFISLAALFMGALNSLKIFFMPALAPACFNIAMITSMLVFPIYLSPMGIPLIYSLALGVLIGCILQMLVQVPMLFKSGMVAKGPIKLISKSTKTIFHRLSIGTVGIAATQINILVTTIIASSLGIGAVSWLSYAFRLFQFPVGVLGVSIASSNLVYFSECWKKGEKKEAVDVLQSSYLLSLFVIIPAFSLMFALSDVVVKIVFERGAFLAADTQNTALAMRGYLLGLPLYGLYKIFAPSFYTLDRPIIPVICSAVSIVLNIIFCWSLAPQYGFAILAVGTSLSMLVNTSLQAFFLNKLLGIGFSFFFPKRFWRILISGGACYFMTLLARRYIVNFSAGFWQLSLDFSIAVICGTVAYVLLQYLLGEREYFNAILKRNR